LIRYLLDTNILSDLLRNPLGAVRQRVALLNEDEIGSSIIVAAELRYGAARRGSPRLTRAVEGMLQRMTILSFDRPADEIYGELRASLEASGTPVGSHDCLIAAHALAVGCILVTANERDFTRVAGLKVENWLR